MCIYTILNWDFQPYTQVGWQISSQMNTVGKKNTVKKTGGKNVLGLN